jgi:predicted Zn-dependent peptidase
MGFLLDHVDEKTFASQRDVVKNERRQNYENAPYGLVSQYLQAALFPENHPYHLLTIGTPEDLDSATLEDVKTFFRTWYVPNNATLVIAGDFDKAKAKEMVEKYFGPIPSGTLPPRRPVPPVSLSRETRIDMVAGVPLARVYVAWPSPPFFKPGDAELDLLAHALTGGKTSRLYKRLVYDMQIAQDVAAYQASAQLTSKFEITATAKPGHTPDELLKAIDEELEKVRTGGVADAELARAKTVTVSSGMFELESVGGRADRLNAYNQQTGDPNYLAQDLARYQNATAEKVAGALRSYLPPNRVVVVVTPKPGAPLAGELVSNGSQP